MKKIDCCRITTLIFLIDYVIRWICSPNPLKFWYQPLSIVDFLSFAPFFVEAGVREATSDLCGSGGTYDPTDNLIAITRLLRLFRLRRLFSLEKSFSQIRVN